MTTTIALYLSRVQLFFIFFDKKINFDIFTIFVKNIVDLFIKFDTIIKNNKRTDEMFTIKTHDAAKSEILGLPDELRGRTIKLIEKLENFGQLQMPYSRSLKNGLFELRSFERNNIARTIYVYQQSKTIFVLHAFVKKTEKTPINALRIARNRLKEMLENE